MRYAILLTQEQCNYINDLLKISEDSLIDLLKWEGQDLMSDEEIQEEQNLIDGIRKAISQYDKSTKLYEEVITSDNNKE